MLAKPDTTEFRLASAIASEFVKEPLKYVGADEAESYCELGGFVITEDLSDPITVKSLRGPRTVPDRFRLLVEAPVISPATRWEPEDHDLETLGKADDLIAAAGIMALFFVWAAL